MRYLISLLISNLLIFQPAFATLNNVDKTQIFSKNLLPNGGFESGKAQWTPNDTADFTTSTTTPLEGGVNAEWDADASTDTLTSTAVTIPSGWYGRNGVASCVFVTPSGTATHEIQAYDGSNVINEASITSSTSPTRTSVNFQFPSSGSISLRMYANADEPNLEIDSCFIGPAEGYNVSSVSQATLVGHAYYGSTTNCTGWTRTNTAMGDFASDTDCPAPTIVSNVGPGTISTADNNLPQITVTNLPPGTYNIKIITAAGMSASAYARLAVTDGATTSAASGFNSTSSTNEGVTVSGIFTYTTTQSSVTFKLQGMSSSGSITLTNDYYENQFYIYRYPTSSEQAYTPDLQAMSWSGYHDNTCSWARTNTAYGDPTADASCALTQLTNNNFGTVSTTGSVLPGIAFTPKKAGRYFVCALINYTNGASTSTAGFQLLDDATVLSNASHSLTATYIGNYQLCGVVVATSTSSKVVKIQSMNGGGAITIQATAPVTHAITWNIFALDQSLPAPVLTNMVTTSSSGGIRTEAARVTCSNSAAAVVSQLGSWITMANGASTGRCTATFSPAFSSAPYCTCTAIDGGGNTGSPCNVDEGQTISASVTSFVRNGNGALESGDIMLHCIGAR